MILVAGCGRDYAPPPLPDEVQQFTTLFAQNCAACHGNDGRWGAGPPLNDPLFLGIISDDELRRVIREGRPGTMMPGFCTDKGGRVVAPNPKVEGTAPAKVQLGPLTPEQVDVLVGGIRRWAPQDARLASYAPILKDQMAGDAKRGQALFDTACAVCHGAKGEGSKGTAGALNEPAFLALISPQEIRRIVFTGRPDDLKMPNYQSGTESRGPDFKPLSPQDIADIAALLLTWRKPAPQVAEK